MPAPKKYTAKTLAFAIEDYFKNGGKRFIYSVGKNTIKEEVLYSILGRDGILHHLDIDRKTWYRYKASDELGHLCERAEDDIYQTRYDLAAIGAIDSSLVIFDLKCNRDWSEKDKRDQSASATPVAVTIQLADTSGGKKGEENGE
jgi:hypothetical protein